MSYQIEPWLLSSLGCERAVCADPKCPECVKIRPDTGRWFITMGHPGFNSRANNGQGYPSRGSALAAMYRYMAR